MLRLLLSAVPWFAAIVAVPAQVAWERMGAGSQFNSASVVFDLPNQRFLAVDGNPLQIKQWNGSSWSTIATAPYAFTVLNHTACFDAVRNRVVIAGVQINGVAGYCIVEWDGTTWSFRNPANWVTGSSWYGSVIWDPVRQKSIIAGLIFYEWDGTTLTSLGQPPNSPYGLFFNPMSGRPVLPAVPYRELRIDNVWVSLPACVQGVQLGLSFHDPVTNTIQATPPQGWSYLPEVWDGTQWRTVHSGAIDPGGWQNVLSLAMDPMTLEIRGVTTGGTYRVVRGALGTLTPFGAGCPGALGVPVLAAAISQYSSPVPVVGKTITFTASNILPYPFSITYYLFGLSNTQWNGATLPLDTAVFGMPGCHLNQSIDSYTAVTWGGVNFAVPGQAGLLGVSFYTQVMGLELMGVSGPGTCMSQSLDCRIGVGW